MIEPKLISAIVPVYNGAKYIASAIESALRQHYRPIELLVIDDGSTDETARVAQSYPDVHYIFQPNGGHAAAKNAGLANSTGDLIAFLDADDYWPEVKLLYQSQFLAEHPETGCIMGRMQNFLHPGVSRPEWVSERLMGEVESGLALGASLVWRWVFDRVGGFDTRYKRSDDLDWFIRMSESGIPIKIVAETFLYRRIHTANASYDQLTPARERLHILKDLIDRKRARSSLGNFDAQS